MAEEKDDIQKQAKSIDLKRQMLQQYLLETFLYRLTSPSEQIYLPHQDLLEETLALTGGHPRLTEWFVRKALEQRQPLLTPSPFERLCSFRPDLHFGGLTDLTEKQLNMFMERLTDNKDENMRANAARILGTVKKEEAVPLLVEALKKDKAGKVRSAAAIALAEIGHSDKDIVSALVERLTNDGDNLVRASAVRALGCLAQKDIIPLFTETLDDEDAMVRLAVITALGEIGHPDAISVLSKTLLGKDENPQMRIAAIEALEQIGGRAVVESLEKAVIQDEEADVRIAAVRTLGSIKQAEAIPALGNALTTDDSVEVRKAAARALQDIRQIEGIPKLGKALTQDKEREVRLAIVHALEKIGGTEAVLPLSKALVEEKDTGVCSTIVNALGKIGISDCIEPLGIALTEDEQLKIRIEAANALGKIKQAETIPPLINALVQDKDPELREVLIQAIYRNDAINWQGKAEQVIHTVQHSRQHRENIDAGIILHVIRPPEEDLAQDRYLLTDYLISQALDKDERMTGVLAQFIIESTGRSLKLAGERVNAYQETHPDISEGAFQRLRIEIGGETALDPIIKELRANLQRNFQKPIAELNIDTHKMWKTTIKSAQNGFTARMVLSVVVFVVGIILLFISSWQIIFGELETEQILGPGVSFVSGLGLVLLIIYSGPLKEIRQSVSDLGIASAAFIAYVHRVLEISHTFSFHYLKEQISFEEMKKSSDLIGLAMSETISELRPRNHKTVEEIFKDAIETVKPTTKGED
jgi:HEAT repeat protein